MRLDTLCHSARELAPLWSAGLAIVLAGCAATSQGPTATTTPTAARTSGPAATATTPEATKAAQESWDLVWFSDSSAAVAELWAEGITAETGVQVRWRSSTRWATNP